MSETQTILDKIIRILAQEYQPDQIILFGSQVEGQAGQNSDIDLLIIKESTATPYQRAVQVRRLLRDPKRLVPLDFLVVTPNELQQRLARGDQFLQTVVATGKVLHAA